MATDTSEKGLETLIVRHMTGTDGLPPMAPMSTGSGRPPMLWHARKPRWAARAGLMTGCVMTQHRTFCSPNTRTGAMCCGIRPLTTWTWWMRVIFSDTKLRVVEIQGANDQKIQALQTALDDLSRALEEKIG